MKGRVREAWRGAPRTAIFLIVFGPVWDQIFTGASIGVSIFLVGAVWLGVWVRRKGKAWWGTYVRGQSPLMVQARKNLERAWPNLLLVWGFVVPASKRSKILPAPKGIFQWLYGVPEEPDGPQIHPAGVPRIVGWRDTPSGPAAEIAVTAATPTPFWEKNREVIANAWGAPSVAVVRETPGKILLIAVVRDPLAGVQKHHADVDDTAPALTADDFLNQEE